MRGNPFEELGLDPRDGVAVITARLKELAEEAADDTERERIRSAWEELTLHPKRRLRAALFAHPETRAPLGRPPAGLGRRPPPELRMRDLIARPSVLHALAEDLGALENELLAREAHEDLPPLPDPVGSS